jgi:hypothetical protein
MVKPIIRIPEAFLGVPADKPREDVWFSLL